VNHSNDDFRNRLLSSERVTPSLKERYEQEIRGMIEKQLTGVGKLVWGLSGVFGLIVAVGFGIVAILPLAGEPWQARVGFAVSSLFAALWAYLGLKIHRRGFMDLKVDAPIYAAFAWGFPVFMVTMFMVWAPDTLMGLRMIVMGLVFLVAGAVFLLSGVIKQSELSTREKLLEIEYRLADLAEAMKPGGLGGDRA
jgi:hypothetical protein